MTRIASAVAEASATAEAMRVIEDAMRPGTGITELQLLGRDVYRKMGVPRPESVLIFFHGLGLSHMDLEEIQADGTPLGDWCTSPRGGCRPLGFPRDPCG